jgi:3'(2'), 5'-bisphosphate nucleotidase
MKVLIEKVKEIALRAGEAILEIYADESLFGVELKKDDSPLTMADQNANAIIVAGLEKLEVQYPIISEETKLVDYSVRKHYDTFWLVDPLDGTKEFIKRNDEFTVNIALISQNSPIMGVVYVPVTGEMYWAYRGEGAFYSKEGISRQLHANEFTMNDNGLRVVASRSHMNEETKEFLDQLSEPSIVSKGSSLKFLILASGDAELYPRIAPTMEWDTAAAQMILEESGGAVLQYGTVTPLRYNKVNLLNPNFVAMASKK